jgi:hypothetical protein
LSYEKKIGLITGTSSDPQAVLSRLGVPAIPHDLKSLLPAISKEPEPKIWLPKRSSFNTIRNTITNGANSGIIPGQFWTGKFPLVSVLTDTRKNGFPTAKLDAQDYSLRLRYEVDPKTGERSYYDFNEKSAMAVSNVIGGLQDRDEREHDFENTVSFEDGYNQFIDKYRILNDRAVADTIPYSQQHVYGGYIASRVEYGFVVKHPKHDVAFVFEACEDTYDTYLYDMCQASQKDVFEFEFEPKQVWGDIPEEIRKSPEAFRAFMYSFMIDIRDHIAATTPGAMINIKSKAENTKEHLDNHVQSGRISQIGLADYYNGRVPKGYSKSLTPLQSSLMLGRSIEKTLDHADEHITYRCGIMHKQKVAANRSYAAPDISHMGQGTTIIGVNDNAVKAQPLVVSAP